MLYHCINFVIKEKTIANAKAWINIFNNIERISSLICIKICLLNADIQLLFYRMMILLAHKRKNFGHFEPRNRSKSKQNDFLSQNNPVSENPWNVWISPQEICENSKPIILCVCVLCLRLQKIRMFQFGPRNPGLFRPKIILLKTNFWI